MRVEETSILGLKLIHQFRAEDERGSFVKVFHEQSFQDHGIRFDLKESFYSISKKDVIRGMHFQHPPFDHAKIVFCIAGAILDVVLDIRKNSVSYGQYVDIELSSENNKALYIPSGMAHGFKALTDNAVTYYLVSSENHKGADDGVLYNSFGYDWRCHQPTLSQRDRNFKPLSEFDTPFII